MWRIIGVSNGGVVVYDFISRGNFKLELNSLTGRIGMKIDAEFLIMRLKFSRKNASLRTDKHFAYHKGTRNPIKNEGNTERECPNF